MFIILVRNGANVVFASLINFAPISSCPVATSDFNLSMSFSMEDLVSGLKMKQFNAYYVVFQ